MLSGLTAPYTACLIQERIIRNLCVPSWPWGDGFGLPPGDTKSTTKNLKELFIARVLVSQRGFPYTSSGVKAILPETPMLNIFPI